VIITSDLKVGTVTHYYDKIGVAVVDLTSPLHIGDRITFKSTDEFSQDVTSMQVEHEQVESAKKGDTIGLKTDKPVKPGDEITKSA
jgi:putative protease